MGDAFTVQEAQTTGYLAEEDPAVEFGDGVVSTDEGE